MNQLDMSWQIYVNCDICSLRICVNNYDDRKTRVPRFLNFILCGNCDPRAIDDRIKNRQERAVIMHPRRLRVLRLAQVTRGLSRFGCLDALGKEGPCKCAGCAAQKLMPKERIGKAIRN